MSAFDDIRARIAVVEDRWETDPAFRDEVERDPEGALRRAGLDMDLASAVAAAADGRAEVAGFRPAPGPKPCVRTCCVSDLGLTLQ